MLLLVVWLSLLQSVLSMDFRYLRREPEVSTTVQVSGMGENCTAPMWGEWFEELPCNDNCGSCGTRVLRRRCLTPDCPCSGSSRRQLSCFIGVCDYPRAACCPPFKITYYQGQFGCGPQEDDIVAEFLNISSFSAGSSAVSPPTPSPPPFNFP